MKVTEQKVLVDLGYFEFPLPERWIATADPVEGSYVVQITRDGATVQFSIFSTTVETQDSDIEKLYNQIYRLGKSKGFHVDDLAEDFDFELLVGQESYDDRYAFTHYFLRKLETVIVVAAMRGHAPIDEEMIRELMGNLRRGKIEPRLEVHEEPLKPLEPIINQDDWDLLVEKFVITGDR